MLGDIRQAKNVYIVTGYTDMRKGIRSLVPYVMQVGCFCSAVRSVTA